MTPNDIQVSRSKVSVEGQAFSLYVGEGGISVLQTAIFSILFLNLEATVRDLLSNLGHSLILVKTSVLVIQGIYVAPTKAKRHR